MDNARRTCCSTKRIATPRSAAARAASNRRVTTSGARPADTSSSNRICGSPANAAHREHLLFTARQQARPSCQQRPQFREQVKSPLVITPPEAQVRLYAQLLKHRAFRDASNSASRAPIRAVPIVRTIEQNVAIEAGQQTGESQDGRPLAGSA